jgi:LmbE family N-acetylglucosaminyl deacetylase
VLCIAEHARHPDHQALARLVRGAVKAAAFHNLATPSGAPAWGGARLWFYEAELASAPAFLVPASEADWQTKLAAIRCYGSQLHRPGSEQPSTTIADPGFIAWIEARGRAWGHQAGAAYAEAFLAHEPPRLADLRAI